MHRQLQQIEQKVLYSMWANYCLNWQLGCCLWSKPFMLHGLHPLKGINWRMSKTFMFTSTSNQYSTIACKLLCSLTYLSVACVVWDAEKKSCLSFCLFDYYFIIIWSFVYQALESPGSWFLNFFLIFRCGPCKIIAPKYQELSEKYLDVVFLKLDCNKDNKVSLSFDWFKSLKISSSCIDMHKSTCIFSYFHEQAKLCEPNCSISHS